MVLAHLKTFAERDEKLLRDSAALTLRRYCQELILDFRKGEKNGPKTKEPGSSRGFLSLTFQPLAGGVAGCRFR